MKNHDPKLTEVIAQALWEASRNEEVRHISGFGADFSMFPRAAKILSKSSPRESVVICASLIAKAIDVAIRFHFSHASPKELKELLEGLGPLSSDASRVRLVKALGWLSPWLCNGANAFRGTRNFLSHEITEFNDNTPTNFLPSEITEKIDESFDRINISLSKNSCNLIDIHRAKSISGYGIMISAEILEEIILSPSKQRLGISNRRGAFYTETDCPSWAQELHLATSDALIEICSYKDEATI